MPISFTPGDVVTRDELNALYGGGIQSGILTPTKHPLVFVFSDPKSGPQYGYTFDGWSPDGSAFYYAGEGVGEDQQFVRKNKAIRDASTEGEEIHIFLAEGTVAGSRARTHKYLGEFELDPIEPWRRETQFSEDGEPYSVIVFKLLPTAGAGEVEAAAITDEVPTSATGATQIPLEESAVDEFAQPAREGTTAKKREAKLVAEFVATLTGETARLRIDIEGQSRPLFTDIWHIDEQELYEAKASVTRGDVRMAVGQLADYRRHIEPEPAKCTVLLPSDPGADLCDLVLGMGFGLVFRRGRSDFVRLDPGGS